MSCHIRFFLNMASQKKDSDSLLNFYRQLIALRQKEPALHKGDYYPVVTDGKTLAYIRRWEGSPSFLMVLNCAPFVLVNLRRA